MRRLVFVLVAALCACAHVPPSPTAMLDEAAGRAKSADAPARTVALAAFHALLVENQPERARALTQDALRRDAGEPYALAMEEALARRTRAAEEELERKLCAAEEEIEKKLRATEEEIERRARALEEKLERMVCAAEEEIARKRREAEDQIECKRRAAEDEISRLRQLERLRHTAAAERGERAQ